MKTDKNKQLMRDYIENVINTCDVSKIHEYLSEDYTEVHGKLRETIGPEIAKKRVLGIYNTFPDFHIRIDQQIAEGDWVVTCCTVTGTHSGIWMNIKPTGRNMEYNGVIVDKIVNGKIAEHGGAVNNFDAFLEAGAIQLIEVDR